MHKVVIECLIEGTNLKTGEIFRVSSKHNDLVLPQTDDVESGCRNLLAKVVNLDFQWMSPELNGAYYCKEDGMFHVEYGVMIPLDTQLLEPYTWIQE